MNPSNPVPPNPGDIKASTKPRQLQLQLQLHE